MFEGRRAADAGRPRGETEWGKVARRLLPLWAGLCLASTPLAAQSLSKAQIAEDAAAFRRMILYSHPKPDQYTGRDSLERLFHTMARVEGDSLPLAVWEERVRRALQPLGCGHTYVSGGLRRLPAGGKKPPPLRLLPFRTFTDGKRLWATGQADSARAVIRAGSEILSLGGRSTSEVLQRFQRYQTADGFNRTFGVRFLNKGRYFNYLYKKYYPRDTLVQVEWRDPEQGVLSAAISLVPENKFRKERPATRPDSLIIHKKKGQYFYYRPDLPSAGVLKIPAFTGHTRRFYKHVFRTLQRRQTPYLVIDLRDNLGGSFGASMNLTRYIADRPFQMNVSRPLRRTWRHMTLGQRLGRVSALLEFDVFNPLPRRVERNRMRYRFRFKPLRRYHYDGQVFILTNGWSCSASSVFSAYAQALGGAQVIGEETGGGARALNGMKIPRFRLPASGIRLSMPQYHLDFLLGPDEGKGVTPDYPTPYSVSDVLEGRDLEWEKALQMILKTRR